MKNKQTIGKLKAVTRKVADYMKRKVAKASGGGIVQIMGCNEFAVEADIDNVSCFTLENDLRSGGVDGSAELSQRVHSFWLRQNSMRDGEGLDRLGAEAHHTHVLGGVQDLLVSMQNDDESGRVILDLTGGCVALKFALLDAGSRFQEVSCDLDLCV